MTAAAEALPNPHCESLASSGASFASGFVGGLVAPGVSALPGVVVAPRVPMLSRALAALRALAPYAAVELLLPGGSLVALVLWLYRRRSSRPQ